MIAIALRLQIPCQRGALFAMKAVTHIAGPALKLRHADPSASYMANDVAFFVGRSMTTEATRF